MRSLVHMAVIAALLARACTAALGAVQAVQSPDQEDVVSQLVNDTEDTEELQSILNWAIGPLSCLLLHLDCEHLLLTTGNASCPLQSCYWPSCGASI